MHIIIHFDRSHRCLQELLWGPPLPLLGSVCCLCWWDCPRVSILQQSLSQKPSTVNSSSTKAGGVLLNPSPLVVDWFDFMVSYRLPQVL